MQIVVTSAQARSATAPNPGPIATARRAAEVIGTDRPHTGWPFLTRPVGWSPVL